MERPVMKAVLMALRPYQWVKNIFIFLPLIFGHQMFNWDVLLMTFLGFAAFSLSASSMYLVNDLIDVDEDRAHPQKKLRSYAAGRISSGSMKTMACVLAAAALILSVQINTTALMVISVYILLNGLYMMYLKHTVIIDAFCIGAFFLLRILMGSATSGVMLSDWIIICTILLALFLIFNKRLYDIDYLKDHRKVYAFYTHHFLERMISIISSSVVIAYSLYVLDPRTSAKFHTPHLIYTIPFVYYGIFRYLYVTENKWHGGDPARILLKDIPMQVNLALWFCVSVAVIYFGF